MLSKYAEWSVSTWGSLRILVANPKIIKECNDICMLGFATSFATFEVWKWVKSGQCGCMYFHFPKNTKALNALKSRVFSALFLGIS